MRMLALTKRFSASKTSPPLCPMKSAALVPLANSLLQNALTDKIKDREVFMKGIDYSYYYEQENDITEDDGK
jgi:hypothetical protein